MLHEKESREVGSRDSSQLPGSKDEVHQGETLDDIPSQNSVINGEKSGSLKTKEGNRECDDVLLSQVPDVSLEDITHDGELPGKLCIFIQIFKVDDDGDDDVRGLIQCSIVCDTDK